MTTARPYTESVRAARAIAGRSPGVKSKDASRLLSDLMAAPPRPRRAVLASLGEWEMRFLLVESTRELGTAFALWHDTASGFVTDVLGETIWSKQREVLDSVLTQKRTAVPAGFGVGKTHLAGRSVVHFVNTSPPGTALAVTTATRFRQVRYQLWPHIRKVVARAGLPGTCDTTQYKLPDPNGVDTVVAYGFTAPAGDEAAMQGIHATRLLLVVDEAGGISRTIGAGTNNLLTGDARMLAIGNPPTDDPGSWFEDLCDEGHSDKHPGTVTIPIAAVDSPRITGEKTPVCRDCQPNLDGHSVALHLPDQDWVDRTVGEFGPEHPYVVAKVYARFPKGAGRKIVPVAWVEAAMEKGDPALSREWLRLCDLGLDGEKDEHVVQRGAWVRLGVDIAADGGDEFVIYRMVGDLIHGPVHVGAGAANPDQVVVAERILEEIEKAERLARALDSRQLVRVKVDKNGLGHGAVGMLERWRESHRHAAEIVGVMVSESTHDSRQISAQDRDAGVVAMRPWRKRDESWIATRDLLRPDPSTGYGRLRLRIDRKTMAQLTTPDYKENASGFTVVESKDSMRRRGAKSPDRAEALLLCAYEPEPVGARPRRGLLIG